MRDVAGTKKGIPVGRVRVFDKRIACFVRQLDRGQGPAASCHKGIKFCGGIEGAGQRRTLKIGIHIKAQILVGGSGSETEISVVKAGQII